MQLGEYVMNDTNNKKAVSILSDIAVSEYTQDITERTFRIFSDAKYLTDLTEKWKNMSQLQSQGHLFEQLETMKFNYNALQKDSELYAKTTGSMDLPHDTANINIYNGVKKVREVQEKSCNNAAKAGSSDMHKSGTTSELVSGGINAGLSIFKEGSAFMRGEQELGETVTNVAISGAKGYAVGYTTTALSKGMVHTISHYLGKNFSKILSKTNAPIVIVGGIANASKSIFSYLKGDIDAERLAEEVSHTAIIGTTCFYYGIWGQTAIPIPVVGALIGSGVGYLIGNILHKSCLIALGDSAVVKAAKERRRVVEAMCLAAIPQIQKSRQELEQKLDQYFIKRRKIFVAAFNEIDKALIEWNPDKYVMSLNKINEQFGTILPFKTFAEFDNFMLSNEALDF